MPPLLPNSSYFTGPLKVIIHSLNGTTNNYTPNFSNQFVEVNAYFRFALNFLRFRATGNPTSEVIPEQWKVVKFDAEARVLEVQQIAGEPVIILSPNPPILPNDPSAIASSAELDPLSI